MSASQGVTAWQASQAAHGWSERLVRLGMVARGVLYLIIGVLAFQVALGSSQQQANQTGALQEVASQPFGTFLVWVLAIGLIGFALWRLAAAAFGPRVDPAAYDAKARVKGLLEGIGYGAIAAIAIGIATGSKTSGGGQSGSKQWTAKVLGWPAGPALVGLVGAAILGAGLYLAYEGWATKFAKELELGRLGPGTRKAVIVLGRFGRIARGAAFGLIGGLILAAAVTYDPNKAKGLDGALKTLAGQPYGPWLLGVIAVGLIAFGVYCFIEARLRRVRTG
jgi:Domain of Unknown Function (DUF1206)